MDEIKKEKDRNFLKPCDTNESILLETDAYIVTNKRLYVDNTTIDLKSIDAINCAISPKRLLPIFLLIMGFVLFILSVSYDGEIVLILVGIFFSILMLVIACILSRRNGSIEIIYHSQKYYINFSEIYDDAKILELRDAVFKAKDNLE